MTAAKMVDLPCPVCAGTELVELYPAEIKGADEVSFSYSFSPAHNKLFRVVRCANKKCTHVYCTPIPDMIADNYREVVDEEYLKHGASRRAAADACLVAIRKLVPKGRLLDVGCATGDFLLSAREAGFEAEGAELSAWSSKIARERGFTVHGKLASELAATHAGVYDVITLWGVIEHFSHPAQVLTELRALLKPGGIIAIWTGDVDGLCARILGRRWWMWMGQHIQYYTAISLALQLETTGYKVEARLRYPFGATYEAISNSLRRYWGNSVIRFLMRPAFALKPVWYLRLPGELYYIGRRAD